MPDERLIQRARAALSVLPPDRQAQAAEDLDDIVREYRVASRYMRVEPRRWKTKCGWLKQRLTSVAEKGWE